MTVNDFKIDLIKNEPSETSPRFSRKQYESLLRSVDGIVWEADAEPFRFTFVNRKAEELLGYPISQWLTEPDFWSNHLHPADREWASELCRRAIAKREDHELEYRMIAADGRIIWFKDHVTYTVDDDQTTRLRGLMTDITARMTATDEIRENEAKLRLLLKQVPAYVWSTDLSLKFTHLAGLSNPSAEYPIGVTLSEYFRTDDPDFLPVLAHKRALQGSAQAFEYRWKNRDYEVSIQPLRNSVGETVGCVGVAHDVTERKVAAENILKEKQLTDAILDSLPGAFMQYDESGKRLRWNKFLEETSGFTTAELEAMPRFFTIADEKRQLAFKTFGEILASGEASLEIDIVTKAGGSRPYFVNARRVEIGRKTSILAMAMDITALKQAEQALIESRKELTEAQRIAKVGSWTWDIATNEVTWSEELYRPRGLDPSLPAPTLDEQKRFYTEETWAKLSEAIQEAITNGTPYELELELVLDSGQHLWFIGKGEAIRDESGQVVKLRGTAQDITERKLSQEELRLSEERFSKAFNANPNPISIQRNSDGAMISVNDRWTEVYGYSHAEASTLTWDNPSRMRLEERERLRRELREHGSLREFEAELSTKSGESRYVSLSSEQIFIDNELCNIFIHRDITDQRFAEESLRESQRRFRETLTNLEMIAVMTDSGGRITFCNDYMLRLTGWDRDSVHGRLWSEVFLPDLADEQLGTLNTFQADGTVTPHFENEIKTLKGEIRSVRWTNTALRDVAGRVIGVASLGDDITERKQAEEALRVSESRYKKIVESAPEGIVVMDLATGHFVDCNPQALDLFGLTEQNITSYGPADMSPEFQPDGRRSDEAIIENIERALAGETPVFEWTHCDQRGKTFPCEVRLLQLPDESRKLIRGTLVDMTAQKRIEQAIRTSEERYRDLVENSIDIIYTHDLNGNFTSINRAGEKITGYTRDEASRLSLSQVVAPEFLETATQAIGKTLAGGGAELLSIDILAKDGRRIAVEVTSSPIFQYDKPIGIQGTARDVTDRKHLEQQLRQAQKLESVGRLAGGIAHDFNNMLTAINGYSDLVLEELASGHSLRPYVEEIKSAGERSALLTQQLLAFSRKQVMQPQIIDVNAVVAGIEQMLDRLIGEDVTMKTNLAPDLGCVMVDPTQIEQVIVNLVVNARDAMPNGGTLTIETNNVRVETGDGDSHRYAKPGSYVVLSVTDTGDGIKDEARQHIFEPFYTTRDVGKGTGLGLATVYGIVKQSDGFIELDTQPGSGTTFQIFLPLVEKAPEKQTGGLNREASLRGTETILLIEDEEAVRTVVCALLRKYGYKVYPATDESEATAICEDHAGAIDLLISDVVMPKTSGPALAKKLLALRRDMKVLYVSGYSGDAIAHHGILASDINFLQKPFTHEALAEKVRRVLGKMGKAHRGN